MDAVQERIEAFGRLEPDDDGECHGKSSIVEELEDRLDDERVLSFFLKVIADPSEFDLARLAALKIFQLWKAPNKETQVRVGRHLARVLPKEEDVLVQQWIAISAENFAGVPEVFAAAAKLVADSEVDLDVRHNCLSVIVRLRGTEQAKKVLRSLVDDEQIGVHVRRILSEWESRRTHLWPE
jgi:hypothetical protein